MLCITRAARGGGSAQNGPFAHQTACVCFGRALHGVGVQIIPFRIRTRMAGVKQRIHNGTYRCAQRRRASALPGQTPGTVSAVRVSVVWCRLGRLGLSPVCAVAR